MTPEAQVEERTRRIRALIVVMILLAATLVTITLIPLGKAACHGCCELHDAEHEHPGTHTPVPCCDVEPESCNSKPTGGPNHEAGPRGPTTEPTEPVATLTGVATTQGNAWYAPLVLLASLVGLVAVMRMTRNK